MAGGVGIRIVTFEACSGFTRVTARRIAQPPKAAFVTRLQPCRLPGRTARQLPDQSTTLWVESSSTSDPRLRGALPFPDLSATRREAWGRNSPGGSMSWMNSVVEIDAGKDGKHVSLQERDQKLERGQRNRQRERQYAANPTDRTKRGAKQ